jgi:hypothetical protein
MEKDEAEKPEDVKPETGGGSDSPAWRFVQIGFFTSFRMTGNGKYVPSVSS